MKKITFFLVLIFVTQCGFEPIYSSKKFLFKIDNINYENNKLNNRIAGSLKTLSNENADNVLDLNLASNKEKRVVSKSKTGDPEIFELSVTISIRILEEQKIFTNKQNYSNNDNKFELNEYEIEIEEQIINKLINEMLIYLASF